MQNLTKFTVQRGDDEYELSLGWDDGAFVERHIKFDISALKKNIETREETEPLSLPNRRKFVSFPVIIH